MTHLIDLSGDPGIFESIKSSGRNLYVLKTDKAVQPGDTVIFQHERWENEELIRSVVCSEKAGLKNGYFAISFKEKEPNY